MRKASPTDSRALVPLMDDTRICLKYYPFFCGYEDFSASSFPSCVSDCIHFWLLYAPIMSFNHSYSTKRKDPPDGDEDPPPARAIKTKPEDDSGDEEGSNKDEDVGLGIFGKDDDQEEDDDDDDGKSDSGSDNDDDFEVYEEDRLIREETRTKILHGGGTYTFHLQLLEFVNATSQDSRGVREISVKVYFESTEPEAKAKTCQDDDNQGGGCVGYLTAFWLPRPVAHDFHEMADSVSDELAELVAMFCNRDGHVTRIDTGLQGRDVTHGGLVQIYSLEVMGPGHAGKCDLGLHLVHETLLFLKDDWNIAVMVPLLLGVHIQKWPDYHNRLAIDPRALVHTKEQTEGLKMAHIKIKRHFACMGFVQAGRNSEHHHAWYLTAPDYFGKDNPTRNGDKAIEKWKSKQEIEPLDIFVAPDKHVPEGVDAELHSVVNDVDGSTLTKVRGLVQKREASIHGSRALFVTAANGDTNLLKVLAEELQGNVNEPDENDNTPLHVAAMMLHYETIEYLLAQGARKDVVNDMGHTPLQTTQESINAMLVDSDDDDGGLHDDDKESPRKCLEILRIE